MCIYFLVTYNHPDDTLFILAFCITDGDIRNEFFKVLSSAHNLPNHCKTTKNIFFVDRRACDGNVYLS